VCFEHKRKIKRNITLCGAFSSKTINIIIISGLCDHLLCGPDAAPLSCFPVAWGWRRMLDFAGERDAAGFRSRERMEAPRRSIGQEPRNWRQKDGSAWSSFAAKYAQNEGIFHEADHIGPILSFFACIW
jgi:hypothetical protein